MVNIDPKKSSSSKDKQKESLADYISRGMMEDPAINDDTRQKIEEWKALGRPFSELFNYIDKNTKFKPSVKSAILSALDSSDEVNSLQQRKSLVQDALRNINNVDDPLYKKYIKEKEDIDAQINSRTKELNQAKQTINEEKITSSIKSEKDKLDQLTKDRDAAAKRNDSTVNIDNAIKASQNNISNLQKQKDKLPEKTAQATSQVSGAKPTAYVSSADFGTKAQAAAPVSKTAAQKGAAQTGAGTGAPAAGAGGVGDKSKKTTSVDVTDPNTVSDFQGRYHVQASLINSNDELKKLFNDAMKGNWPDARFQAEFLNTKWAQEHAESWQNAERARLSAVGTYANSYNRMREAIARVAVQMGETVTPDQLGPEITDLSKPHDRLNNLTEWALDQSWGKGVDETALRQHIAQVGKLNTALPGGEAANTMNTLKEIARNYGMSNLSMPGGNDYFSNAAQSILLGKSTEDTWKTDIMNQAKDKYRAFAAQIDAGQTVQALAAPYINSLANILEVPYTSIDISSSTGDGKMVADALTNVDANGKPQAIPLYDFEKKIQADPRWQYTNNARDKVMGGVESLLRTFGKIA